MITLCANQFLTESQSVDLMLRAGHFVHVSKATIKFCMKNVEVEGTIKQLLSQGIILENLFRVKNILYHFQHYCHSFCFVCGKASESTVFRYSFPIFPSSIDIGNDEGINPLCEECHLMIMGSLHRRYYAKGELEEVFTEKLATALKQKKMQERILQYKRNWENIRFDPRQ